MTLQIELDGKEKKLKLHRSVVDVGDYKEVYVKEYTSDENSGLLSKIRSRLEAKYSTISHNRDVHTFDKVLDDILLRNKLNRLERQLFSKKMVILYGGDIDGELKVLYSSIEKKIPTILEDFAKIELTEDKKGIEIIVTGDVELIYRL
jgi:hypothetical protein